MTQHIQNDGFNTKQFLDELLEEMGLHLTPEKELNDLKKFMQAQMDHAIMTAVSMHLEGSVIDDVFERYADETNSDAIFIELVANSPNAQIAIIEALGEYRRNTLDAFKTLAKQS